MRKIVNLNMQLIPLIVFIVAFSVSADAARKKTKRKKHEIKIEHVIETIDTLFSNNFSDEISDSIFDMTKSKITSYIEQTSTKYKNIDTDSIYSYYYNKMLDTSDSCEINPSKYTELKVACFKFLTLDAPIENNIAYEGCIESYIEENNIDGLRKSLERFEKYSKDCKGAYDDIISGYRADFRYYLEPTSFEEDMKGYWVSTSHICTGKPKMNFPFSIIEISDLDINSGVRLVNVPGIQNNYVMGALLPQRSSSISSDIGYIQFGFNYAKTDLGNAEFAKSGFESTRKFRADMRASINNSKASIGDQLTATALTEVTAGLLDMLFMSSATSHRSVETMVASLSTVSPTVLQGPLTYYSYKVNTNNANLYNPRPVFNSNITYVKWEKNDSVWFISNNEKLISPYYNKQAQDKLKQIKETYSWKQPKYLVPVIAAEVVGAGLMIYGISSLANYTGGEDGNSGNLAVSIISMIVGETAMIAAPLISYSIRHNKIAKECAAINKENLNRLSKKVPMTVTFTPGFNPQHKAVGLVSSITF